jgi:hypothetical protein
MVCGRLGPLSSFLSHKILARFGELRNGSLRNAARKFHLAAKRSHFDIHPRLMVCPGGV